jgi:hypothetical protein
MEQDIFGSKGLVIEEDRDGECLLTSDFGSVEENTVQQISETRCPPSNGEPWYLYHVAPQRLV